MSEIHDCVSAFADGEPVDPEQLDRALADAEGRAYLIDLLVLRGLYGRRAPVTAVPDVPDVALLAVPAGLTEAAVIECVEKGVRGAVIFSAGYAESGEEGLAIQQRISDIARAGGLRLLGPNCLGIFNPQIGFFGTFTQSLDREMPKPGPLGIISQSGAYGSHIAYLARRRDELD